MAGKFLRTITLTLADTPYQLSALMRVVDSTCELHVAELNIIGAAGSTIYLGDVTMVSPGAGLPPVDYIWFLDGDANPYNSGGGRDKNFIHCTDYWVMGLAVTQKARVETITR